jgi:hypothetical protein
MDRIILFLISLILSCITVSGQEKKQPVQSVIEAISTGDSGKLGGYLNSTIDLEAEEIDGSYSKAQAEIILRNFFDKNPVKSFTVNHEGNSNDRSKYIIGTYKSSNEKKFRVYVLFKETGDQQLIYQLQFELD